MPSFLSCSSYGTLARARISFVALLCTFSKHSMSLLWYGFQTWTQYSRCGRIYMLYSILKLSTSIFLKLRFISPRTDIALLAAFLHWWLHLGFLSIHSSSVSSRFVRHDLFLVNPCWFADKRLFVPRCFTVYPLLVIPSTCITPTS